MYRTMIKQANEVLFVWTNHLEVYHPQTSVAPRSIEIRMKPLITHTHQPSPLVPLDFIIGLKKLLRIDCKLLQQRVSMIDYCRFIGLLFVFFFLPLFSAF